MFRFAIHVQMVLGNNCTNLIKKQDTNCQKYARQSYGTMPTNIFTKIGEDGMKSHRLREQTRLIWPIFDKFRAINKKCLIWFGWLSNLAEILCPQTFSSSLVKIRWKLWLKEWTRQIWPISYKSRAIIKKCQGWLLKLAVILRPYTFWLTLVIEQTLPK